MLNKPYLSFQEIVEKTEKQSKAIKEMLEKGHFFAGEANIYQGQKAEDHYLLKEAMSHLSLSEVLSRGQTLGDYLVATKVSDTLTFGSRLGDHVPFISAYVATDWVGGDLDVAITGENAHGWSFEPSPGSSGAIMNTDTVNVVKATCSPVLFGYNMRISEDLVEDAAGNSDLIEFHIQKAGQELGYLATRMAVKVLFANGDGAGTANAIAGDTGEIKMSGSTGKDITSAIGECGTDGFVPHCIITNPTSFGHSIGGYAGNTFMTPAEGFDFNVNGMDILVYPATADLTATRICAIVFDRRNALFTARKRWLQIENYSDPVKDLAGAVVTARQDSVTLYKDAQTRVEEAA